VTPKLDAIEAFTESGPSKQDLNSEAIQVEETSRPTKLTELVSKEMYVEAGRV
jgi:hypothetical protein